MRLSHWFLPSAEIIPSSICYCAGVGEDISFELGLIEQFGARVFALLRNRLPIPLVLSLSLSAYGLRIRPFDFLLLRIMNMFPILCLRRVCVTNSLMRPARSCLL